MGQKPKAGQTAQQKGADKGQKNTYSRVQTLNYKPEHEGKRLNYASTDTEHFSIISFTVRPHYLENVRLMLKV